MNVRIRIPRGQPLKRAAGKNRQAALAIGALLAPASLMAYTLGVWRLASDIGIAGEFGITGVFSHWQVWIGLAIALHLTSASLNRYGKGGELAAPKVFTTLPLPRRIQNSAQEQKGA